MREDVKELAIGRWRQILPEMGVPASTLTGKHGPCPMCGGTDRFRFDDREGRGTWYCNQCGAGDGWNLLMQLKEVEFRGAADLVRKLLGEVTPMPAKPVAEKDARPKLREIWKASSPVKIGDPVHNYLVNRIGWPNIPKGLRTHMSLAHRGGDRVTYHPAMLALVSDLHGDPISLHRTYLTEDGHKANVDPVRMNMGKMPDGCAIRLADYQKTLGVAEGIETALAAMVLFRIPVWSCINANRLEAWSPPEGVTQIIVFGDHDENYVGQRAAYALAERLERSDAQVEVQIPPSRGDDWNDVLDRENAKRGAA